MIVLKTQLMKWKLRFLVSTAVIIIHAIASFIRRIIIFFIKIKESFGSHTGLCASYLHIICYPMSLSCRVSCVCVICQLSFCFFSSFFFSPPFASFFFLFFVFYFLSVTFFRIFEYIVDDTIDNDLKRYFGCGSNVQYKEAVYNFVHI